MGNPQRLMQSAAGHYQVGRFGEAARCCLRVLETAPDHGDALSMLGAMAYQAGDGARAIAFLSRAAAAKPKDPHVHNLMGLALLMTGEARASEAGFRDALAILRAPEFYNNLGNALKAQDRVDEAMNAYREALTLNPGYAGARYNLGNAHRKNNDLPNAAACFQKALALAPGQGNTLASLGEVTLEMGRADEALPMLLEALTLMPDDADLHCSAGNAFQALGKSKDATAAYRRAVQLNPRLAKAWYGAGCVSIHEKDYAGAVENFKKALEIIPNWAEAQHNLGQSLFNLGQVEQAVDFFRAAAAVGPPKLPRLAIAVAIPGDPRADNRTVAEDRRRWAESSLPPAGHVLGVTPPAASAEAPVRLGYLSSFFGNHNWMKPVWGLINQHDRGHFEIQLFSHGPISDIAHGYLKHPADRFHDISGMGNASTAERIRTEGIDILVDLNGYSDTRRLPLIARHPAPVVVGWFNMFAASGMAGYDYLIGDHTVLPPGEEGFYREKILRVPGSYLTFEVRYPVPDVAPPPCADTGRITFGCFASQYKMTNDVIAAWARILDGAPESLLMLKNARLGAAGNVRFVKRLLKKNGISEERVILEGPSDHYRFIEAYGRVDLALDTFPYNGGTTTTEALWQGVPVITFRGDRWASRTSASILDAAGLSEYVARDLKAYVALATQLANASDTCDRLAILRQGMRRKLRNAPVCDTRGFARNMEQIYTKILPRRAAGPQQPGP